MTKPLYSPFLSVLIAIVGGIFMAGLNWGNMPDTRYTIAAMVNGTADKPFVTRALVPLFIRGLTLIPGMTLDLATIIATYIGFMAFVLAFGWLVSSVGLEVKLKYYLVALLGLVPFLFGITQIYDIGTLALFPAAIAAMQQRRWMVYLLLFTLACINRETAFLLGLLYLVLEYRQVGRERWWMPITQITIFMVIRYTIAIVFANNPGGPVEYHWAQHIPTIFAKLDYTAYAVSLISIVLYLAFRHHRDKPPILVTSALVFLPVLTLAYFVVGVPFEFRIFFEVYPVLVLLAMYPTTSAGTIEYGGMVTPPIVMVGSHHQE